MTPKPSEAGAGTRKMTLQDGTIVREGDKVRAIGGGGGNERGNMKWEVLADKKFAGDWRVEAINDSGDIFVAVFSGPDAQHRAEEYLAWKLNTASD